VRARFLTTRTNRCVAAGGGRRLYYLPLSLLFPQNVYDPRFNICSPGADADIYFSYACREKRLSSLQAGLKALMYGHKAPPGNDRASSRGSLEDGCGPILFSMARLDKVKNLAGLATWYADSPRLQAVCGLLIVGGDPGAEEEGDSEAASEAAALHALFESGRLPPGKARWVAQQTNPVHNGELYRLVADSRGAFVLPSLFENFGLTVVEAASSGLPVFVSCHGGCSEIIHDGQGGRHIDPYHGRESADRMAAFFEAREGEGQTWEEASAAALARVASRYNWATYARSLVTMSRVYSFWSTATRLDQAAAARRGYLDLVYQLILRPLMSRVPVPVEERVVVARSGSGAAPHCQGACAIALDALADPGVIAPAAGGGGSGSEVRCRGRGGPATEGG
jgi:sucrose synthase